MKILVLGAGFAGIEAVKVMQDKLDTGIHSLTLIDRNQYTQMLPAIPDVAGAWFDREHVITPIRDIVNEKVILVQDDIHNINFENRYLQSEKKKYHYDMLIIANGAQTNFYNLTPGDHIYQMDSVEHAMRVREDFTKIITEQDDPVIVISGAGYTGLELAASLRTYAEKNRKNPRIVMIERGGDILPFLPDDEREYIRQYLEEIDIEIIFDSFVKESTPGMCVLKNGEHLDNSMLIWCAGTCSGISSFVGDVKRLNDGRFVVEDDLSLKNYPEVFAVGDAAGVEKDGNYLRKAVNFAFYGGKTAAQNLIAKMEDRQGRPFRPFDAGWVIPLHSVSVGRIFSNIRIKGVAGLRLHYFMSGFRNYSMSASKVFYKRAITLFGGQGLKNLFFRNDSDSNLGLLFLRIFMGIGLMTHGYGKLFGGLEGFTQFVEKLNIPLPGMLGPIAAVSEFVGGLCLVMGFMTPVWSLLIGINMTVAAFVAHGADPFAKKELALIYLFLAIFFALKGAGRFSADYFIMRKR
ncbi:MAG: FAD-dependent oxidoreductase [Candidatus Muiribacteriaceae bacterium]